MLYSHIYVCGGRTVTTFFFISPYVIYIILYNTLFAPFSLDYFWVLKERGEIWSPKPNFAAESSFNNKYQQWYTVNQIKQQSFILIHQKQQGYYYNNQTEQIKHLKSTNLIE